MNVYNTKKIFWLSARTFLLATLLQNTAVADGDITTSFVIESQYFKDRMSAETVTQVQTDVSTKLAEKIKQSNFPFLNWQADDGTPASSPQLILKMEDVSGGACDPQPSITLTWSGLISAPDEPEDLENIDIYDLYITCDPDMPIHNPKRLQTDIIKAIELMLGSESAIESISKIVSKVPFASRLIIHPSNWVLLPMSAAELKADFESEITAEFDFLGIDDNLLSGDIEMQPNKYMDEGLRVSMRSLTILPDRHQATLWDDKLEQVLQAPSNMKIFMRDYVRDQFAGKVADDDDIHSEP